MSALNSGDIQQLNAVAQLAQTISDKLPDNVPKSKAGRPRKYKDAYIHEQAERLTEWARLKWAAGKPFLLKEWLIETGHNYDAIESWAKFSPTFKNALDRTKLMQEVMLFNCMFGAKTNPIPYMFALKAIANWKEADKQTAQTQDPDDYYKKMRALAKRLKPPKSATKA